VTGLGGVLLYQVSDWLAALMILALVACVLGLFAILETVGRRIQADHLSDPIPDERENGEGQDA
jgi:hypothetical protein